MKKIIIFILTFLLIVIAAGFGLYYWQAKTKHFGPVGPGLPGECFIVFKPSDNKEYSNLVLGVFNKNTYNPITKQQGEAIFPYFQIKKASNEYYYGWMKICLFGVQALSNNERLVILKNYQGSFYIEGANLPEGSKAIGTQNIEYDNFKFAEYYYCYGNEDKIIDVINENNIKSSCTKGY